MEEKSAPYLGKLILLIFSIGLLLASYFLLNKAKNIDAAEKTVNPTDKNIVINNDDGIISMDELNLLVNEQKFDQAIYILEEMYNKNPEISSILNYANVLANIGSINRKEKEYGEKAIKVASEVFLLDANNSEAYRIIGYSNEIMEKYDEAFSNYNKSIELDGKNALAYSNRGHAYKLIGDSDKALTDFLKAYELNNKLDHTLSNLATIYLGKGETDKALKYYNEVIDISTNIRFKSEALFSIGSIQTNNKDFEEADKTFRKAIETDPYFELGYIGLAKGQFFILADQIANNKNPNAKLLEQSIQNLNTAIQLNPNKALSYYILSSIYLGLERFEEYKYYSDISKSVVPVDITLDKNEKEAFLKMINNLK